MIDYSGVNIHARDDKWSQPMECEVTAACPLRSMTFCSLDLSRTSHGRPKSYQFPFPYGH